MFLLNNKQKRTQNQQQKQTQQKRNKQTNKQNQMGAKPHQVCLGSVAILALVFTSARTLLCVPFAWGARGRRGLEHVRMEAWGLRQEECPDEQRQGSQGGGRGTKQAGIDLPEAAGEWTPRQQGLRLGRQEQPEPQRRVEGRRQGSVDCTRWFMALQATGEISAAAASARRAMR